MSAATASPTPTSNNAMTDSLSDNEMNNSIESSAVRKRTRATAEQLAVLEDTFAANVSPNSKLRKQLSERLQMSERSIQIWFQNRRAKVKHMQKRAQMQMQQASIRAQLYHYHQQQYGMHPTPPPHPQQQPYPIMPLPQQQQQQQYNHHPHHPHHRVPLPAAAVRAQSVDTSMNPTPPASITSSSSTDSPSSSLDSLHNLPPSHHLSNTTTTTTSYPLQENMDFPDYLNGGPLSPSPSPHHDFQSVPLSHPLDNSNDNGMTTSSTALPTLVSVPDAGPTAMLTTGSSSSSPSNDHLMSTPATTPPTSLVEQPTVSPQDIWPASIYHTNLMRSQSVAAIPMATSNSEFSSTHLERSLSNPPVTTIDPSNLMMNHRLSATPPVENATTSTTTQENNTDNNNKSSINTNDSSSNSSSEIYDVYLNCTTLTIGTWHRLKLRASDLLCVLKDNVFEWHIEDAGCHFKMEIALSSVASIDFVEENNGLADVHFDISESPLFYMETTNNNNNNNNENNTSSSSSTWVQCSDFTEGKQASRFFRHSLKGVSQHLKQDLMTLMDKCPDARRWVRFLDPLSSTTTTHPHQHQHTTSHFQPSYPLTTFDPMLTTGAHPFNPSNPLMATTMTPPPPPPPSHPNASSYLHPSYWSSMYSQTPMMMGVSNYLV